MRSFLKKSRRVSEKNFAYPLLSDVSRPEGDGTEDDSGDIRARYPKWSDVRSDILDNVSDMRSFYFSSLI